MYIYLNNIKITVIKCKKPSFSFHRGRTWDHGKMILDGKEIKLHLDTTWGHWLYFQWGENNNWFKVRMYSQPEDQWNGKGEYDLDPFETTPLKLTTKR